jgi:sugar phosphate isomerase/epimerase
MIPVALSTGSVYTYSTARAMELAARAGYDGVELMVDDRWDTRQAGYLRRLVDDTVPILSVHSPFGSIPGWPHQEVERVKLALELAETLGARTLNVHVPFRVQEITITAGRHRWRLPILPADSNQRHFARWLTGGGLAALQARTPVTIAVEHLPVRRVLGRRYSVHALNTWGALETFPKVCLDTTHCGTTGSDLLDVYRRLAHRIAHVHLSDYNGRYQHQPVERGHLPLAALLTELAAHRFGGIVVVELTPSALPMQDEGKLEAELRRNLTFCRTHLGAREAGEVVGSPTHPRTGAARVPVVAG